MKTRIADVFALGVSERLQLVEDLWDSIAAQPESVPVPAWQKAELKKRKANARKNPDAGVSWEEAKRRIRRRHG
jgi:putative addiction module component (TIGR02574 family)